ncbi:hypothetical protein D5039_02505 [Verminephrobacter aporrectodeae subsp. tuberculatae]|uniref:Group II intron maturase-specific domain-containing protein n=1 Tax=Verminephrobacter aporrectodeae subsp. tuberculatae TaxID=1110392 RepID=A0ABT3KP55_9BURK|nr:hypothetical protein [Verminephrobacter aporrectodeae subsp. tuberculatae]
MCSIDEGFRFQFGPVAHFSLPDSAAQSVAKLTEFAVKLQRRISRAARDAFRNRVRKLTTRQTLHWSLDDLFQKLNPILRGWAHFYRSSALVRSTRHAGLAPRATAHTSRP